MSLQGKHILELGEKGEIHVEIDPKSDMLLFRVGERKILVKKSDMYGATFAMADPETQEKMMPVRRVQMVTYKRVHHVKVTKPLKPGDTVNVQCAINVEQSIHESLAGIFDKKPKSKSGIVIPQR